MLVIYERNTTMWEPYLVIDHENDEMWGYDPMWSNSADLLGMDPADIKARYEDSFNWAVEEEAEEDPFEDIPMSAEVLRNYPPGTEEHPHADEAAGTDEKMADRAAKALEEKLGGENQGN